MAKKISSLHVALGATVAPFTKAFGSAGTAVSGLASKLSGAGGTLLKFTGLAGGIGAVFGALKGAASGITLAAELEQVGVAFETMLGSGEAAKALMGDLTGFASATPFEFPEIAASAKKLLAFGVGAADMTNKLTMLGDIAAGIGAPLEDIASIYGKIKSRGQLTGETLNQMAERGIPIYRALSQTLGVAESQIAGMVSKGQIGFGQVDQALNSLTASGGQFAGMMEKQSQTLAGLWSTLTDNIGLTMAGLVTTIVDAFSLRDALKGLSGAVESVGGMITGAVARIAPIVVSWMGSLWNVITSTFTAIQAWLQPIVQGIGDFIAANWQTTVQAWTAYLMGAWQVVKAVFGAVWEIVQAAGSAVVSAWTWAMDALGLSTAGNGAGITGVFQTIQDWGMWLMDKVTFAFNAIAFAVTNWRDTLELAAVGAIYQVVKFANEAIYFFSEVIPGVLRWFADNWRDIFATIWSGTKAVFSNMATNAGNFFKAIWSWMKGDGFNFKWTGLLEGFENTIKEMPAIAERQIGPLEKSLADEAGRLGGSYADKFRKFMDERSTAAEDAGKAITNSVKGIGDQLAGDVPAPQVPDITAKVTTDTSELDAVGAKAKATADQMQALFSGSAEAQRARFEATFASRLAKSTSTPAASSTPSAAPVPPSASKAMREGSDQATFLKQLVELAKAGNRTLIDIFEKDGIAAANV